jgi:hypothetical protein
MSRNYYDILGVRRGATKDEVKRAYRRRARLYHPDINPSPDAERKFIELNEAYEALIEGRSAPVTERVQPQREPEERTKEAEPRHGHHRDPYVSSETLRERARESRAHKAREGQAYYLRYKRSRKHSVSKYVALVSILVGILVVLEYALPYQHGPDVVHDKYELKGELRPGKTVESRYHLVTGIHDVGVRRITFNFAELGDSIDFYRTAIFGQLLKIERGNETVQESMPMYNLLLSGVWFYLLVLFAPLLRPVVEGPHVSFYFFDFAMRTGFIVLVIFVLLQLLL